MIRANPRPQQIVFPNWEKMAIDCCLSVALPLKSLASGVGTML